MTQCAIKTYNVYDINKRRCNSKACNLRLIVIGIGFSGIFSAFSFFT